MRRLYIITIPLITIQLLFFTKAHAVDISLGGNLWYNWWQPSWYGAKGKSTSLTLYSTPVAQYGEADSADYRVDPSLLYGPVLSIRFLDRWSVSSVFVCGKFSSISKGITRGFSIYSGAINPAVSFQTYNRDIFKWESDTTISYSPLRFFKIFAGFKTQGYRYEGELKVAPFKLKDSSEMVSFGSGLGVSFTAHLVKGLYLVLGASGIILWGFDDYDLNFAVGPAYTMYFFPEGRFLSYGGTAAGTFVYAIDQINTSLSLGFRYQALKYSQKDGNVAMNIYDNDFDHFYGITFSAVYTFKTGKKSI
jgi:hypothetical protein